MVEGMAPEQVKYMTDKIPMKRFAFRGSYCLSFISLYLSFISLYFLDSCGTIEEVASIATWIVSREASFNTGFCFDLSGGRATY